MVLLTMVMARYFGRKAYGSIRGTLLMFQAIFGMAAPIYAGWIYDTTNSYTTALNLCAALAGLAAILMAFARPPKPPAQVADVRKFL